MSKEDKYDPVENFFYTSLERKQALSSSQSEYVARRRKQARLALHTLDALYIPPASDEDQTEEKRNRNVHRK